MKSYEKKKPYKRIALAFSLCALLIWTILGTGASLAWFADTSEEVVNIFQFADFELAVSHRLDNGRWEPIDGKTDIFDDEALYEPGYVQVVYLKVENKGDRAFQFKTAVIVNGYTTATNVFGQRFHLPDYLRFGVVIADKEEVMDKAVGNRDLAKKIATTKLSNYCTDVKTLEPGASSYMALVVHMPEDVGNEANYRGTDVPEVNLGITVTAYQEGTPNQ